MLLGTHVNKLVQVSHFHAAISFTAAMGLPPRASRGLPPRRRSKGKGGVHANQRRLEIRAARRNDFGSNSNSACSGASSSQENTRRLDKAVHCCQREGVVVDEKAWRSPRPMSGCPMELKSATWPLATESHRPRKAALTLRATHASSSPKRHRTRMLPDRKRAPAPFAPETLCEALDELRFLKPVDALTWRVRAIDAARMLRSESCSSYVRALHADRTRWNKFSKSLRAGWPYLLRSDRQQLLVRLEVECDIVVVQGQSAHEVAFRRASRMAG